MDIDFELSLQPYISQNNNVVRLNILDDKITFGDYKYVLRTREDSQFDSMLGKFSNVFSEHLRKQLVSEMSTKFGHNIRSAIYGIFRRLQQNNKVGDGSVLMNKHASQICYVPGRPIYNNKKQIIDWEPGSLGIEFQGSFNRKQDLINRTTKQEQQLTGSETIQPGEMLIYLSKSGFDSLLETKFRQTLNLGEQIDPIQMSVEDLEDYISGFQTAFDESDKVNITIGIDKIKGVSFDKTFGNLPFTAEATISFSNPIETSFSSAEAKIAFKGIAEVEVNDRLGLNFKVSQERVVVTSLHPFFQSDTTLKEFESEFVKNIPVKFL